MNRRKFMAATGISLVPLAGCTTQNTDRSPPDSRQTEQRPESTTEPTSEPSNTTSPTPSETTTGTLSTAISDNPGDINDFEHLWVTIEEIWVHQSESAKTSTPETNTTTPTNETQTPTLTPQPESDPLDESVTQEGGKYVLPVDSREVDLVKLQGDAQSIISDVSLPTGEYEQVKLWVSDATYGTLKSGEEVDVTTPGDAPLKFNKSFEVRPDTTTTFVADFSPHARGKNAKNGYIVKPVPSEVAVSYSDSTTSQSEGNSTTSPEDSSETTRTTTTE